MSPSCKPAIVLQPFKVGISVSNGNPFQSPITIELPFLTNKSICPAICNLPDGESQ